MLFKYVYNDVTRPLFICILVQTLIMPTLGFNHPNTRIALDSDSILISSCFSFKALAFSFGIIFLLQVIHILTIQIKVKMLGQLGFIFILIFWTHCYKLVQGFRVICFITGQYNTKGYGTITDVI